MPISKKYQKRINDLVKDSDFKMSELPKKIGINHATLSHSLNYGIIPSPKTLILVADYFNKPFEFILGKTDEETFEKTEKDESFYNRIDFLLESQKITFYSLAINQIGIDQSSLSSWKKRKLLPSLEILMSIAKHFKCSIDFLLGRTDEANRYVEAADFDINFDDNE